MDGRFVKLFRRKRIVSTALLKPYAERFVENAKALKTLEIPTVDVVDVFYCQEIKRTLVVYHPLPGRTLRDVCRTTDDLNGVLTALGKLIAKLHVLGVLFRSLHFGNIIVLDAKDNMGLIDMADMKIKSTSLSLSARARNFRHLIRYQEDQDFLTRFGVSKFLEIYLQATDLNDMQRKKLHDLLRKDEPFFTGGL